MKDNYDSVIPVACVVSVDGTAYSTATAVSASAPPAPYAQPTLLAGVQNQEGAKTFLSEHQWPQALQEAFISDACKVPLRFFICDDSGSMQANDGKRIVDVKGVRRFVPCSRWVELTGALRFHVGLAHAGLIPTEFRLLNAAAPIRIGFDATESANNVTRLVSLFDESPSGGTPLCRHVADIVAQIRAVEPQLRAAGQKACIIIATDGESSDGNVADALRPLKDLPAWVVVRLCTDEENIVEYWNNIDGVLELNVDVLDDLSGEAQEIRKVNPWFTYTEAMHRMREFGVSLKEIDLLDEALLPKEQMRKVCRLIYGKQVDNLPMPEVDVGGFVRGLESLNESTPRVWSPADGKLRHWVEASAVSRAYGGGTCAIM